MLRVLNPTSHGVALPAAAASGHSARVVPEDEMAPLSTAGAGMSCSGRRLAQSMCGARGVTEGRVGCGGIHMEYVRS
jgi:hypothetical protein